MRRNRCGYREFQSCNGIISGEFGVVSIQAAVTDSTTHTSELADALPTERYELGPLELCAVGTACTPHRAKSHTRVAAERRRGRATGSTATSSFARKTLSAALAGVAVKDVNAMKEVYRRTRLKLLSTCARILESQSEAEEVLQEVYLTVWKSAGQFDAARASPMTWLTTVARNKAIDRKRTARAAPLASMDSAEQMPDLAPSAPYLLELAELGARLRHELSRLHASQCRVLEMAFLDEMTHDEIADALGLPLGTIKSRIRAGLARLRTILTDVAPERPERPREARAGRRTPTFDAESPQARSELNQTQD